MLEYADIRLISRHYIDICYEEYNSMGIKGILQDLKLYMEAIEGRIEIK